MASGKKDNNSVSVAQFASNADGVTPIMLRVTAGHRLVRSNGTSGTPPAGTRAARDENHEPVMLGVSTDGVTVIEPYIDSSTFKLLTKST
jgi:hypothetical protein